ncbi:hypothetical protein TWF730_002733 [Orbilia blumenaviensis]|uniref:Uncharacterized protein n=1 Tax=Orbilia blumenaviensis TaxID=1796055 RepID=A0AAV9U783_9PEZI
MILSYLDDFSALSLGLTSRAFYNRAVERIQNIICPLNELGSWAGKPLVRAGVVLDMGDEFSRHDTEIDETSGGFLMAVIEAKMLGLRERGYHTIYDSDSPERLETLRFMAQNRYTPPVVRRYLSAVLGNTEYENMFQEGRQYLIRNLDKKEYIQFPTGRLERTVVRPSGVYDDTMEIKPHPAERVIEAITWAPSTECNTSLPSKGAWAGDRIDIIMEEHASLDEWKRLL